MTPDAIYSQEWVSEHMEEIWLPSNTRWPEQLVLLTVKALEI